MDHPTFRNRKYSNAKHVATSTQANPPYSAPITPEAPAITAGRINSVRSITHGRRFRPVSITSVAQTARNPDTYITRTVDLNEPTEVDTAVPDLDSIVYTNGKTDLECAELLAQNGYASNAKKLKRLHRKIDAALQYAQEYNQNCQKAKEHTQNVQESIYKRRQGIDTDTKPALHLSKALDVGSVKPEIVDYTNEQIAKKAIRINKLARAQQFKTAIQGMQVSFNRADRTIAKTKRTSHSLDRHLCQYHANLEDSKNRFKLLAAQYPNYYRPRPAHSTTPRYYTRTLQEYLRITGHIR